MSLIEALAEKMEGKYRFGTLPTELAVSRVEVFALLKEYRATHALLRESEAREATLKTALRHIGMAAEVTRGTLQKAGILALVRTALSQAPSEQAVEGE